MLTRKSILRCVKQHGGEASRMAQQKKRASSTSASGGRRRVVVTGLGLVTPLGVGVEHNWNRLIAGECGLGNILAPDENSSRIPVKVAGCVPRGTEAGQLNLQRSLLADELSHSPAIVQLALVAAGEALKDANWFPSTDEDKSRTGVAIGGSVGSIQDCDEASKSFQQHGYKKMSPFFITKILTNMSAGLVSIKYGLEGPNHACSTACATGAHSLGDAYKMVRDSDADVMVAGASEASITPLALAGFSRARALATKFNETPHQASRPFDRDRNGFVMGEGAGIMVLEELEHARARGAPIYAELKGYGMSGDGYHITAPRSDGRGAMRAIQAALRNAELSVEDIDYINAHATSTPLGDRIENAAIKAVFGPHAYKLAVSSTKGATGHLLAAAGSVEAIFSVLAIRHGKVPPTLNLHNPDPEFDLNYVPLVAQERNVVNVLTNSFGFGGTNASLVFSRI